MKKVVITVLFAALLVSCAEEPLTNNPPVVREKPAAVAESEQAQAETPETAEEDKDETAPRKGKLKAAEQTELFYTYQSRLSAGKDFLVGAKDDAPCSYVLLTACLRGLPQMSADGRASQPCVPPTAMRRDCVLTALWYTLHLTAHPMNASPRSPM